MALGIPKIEKIHAIKGIPPMNDDIDQAAANANGQPGQKPNQQQRQQHIQKLKLITNQIGRNARDPEKSAIPGQHHQPKQQPLKKI